MFRLCSYCKADLGEIEPLADTRETHGVCPTCYTREMQKMASPEVAVEETPPEQAPIVFTCGCTYGRGKYIFKCFKHSDFY